MDELQEQLLAEDLNKNEWFHKVFAVHMEALETKINNASLDNQTELLEAAIALRYLKRTYARLLEPLKAISED